MRFAVTTCIGGGGAGGGRVPACAVRVPVAVSASTWRVRGRALCRLGPGGWRWAGAVPSCKIVFFARSLTLCPRLARKSTVSDTLVDTESVYVRVTFTVQSYTLQTVAQKSHADLDAPHTVHPDVRPPARARAPRSHSPADLEDCGTHKTRHSCTILSEHTIYNATQHNRVCSE